MVACGASEAQRKNNQTDQPDESDLDLCAKVCAKQRTCAGLEPDDQTIAVCANGCFRNLTGHPTLVPRLRAVERCLNRTCGADFDQCAATAHVDTSETPFETIPGAAALTPEQCRVVCQKTFQCLGDAKMSREGLDGCVLGCTQGSAASNNAGQRYRAVLACAAQPCGAEFQQCTAAQRTKK